MTDRAPARILYLIATLGEARLGMPQDTARTSREASHGITLHSAVPRTPLIKLRNDYEAALRLTRDKLTLMIFIDENESKGADNVFAMYF